jgi:uncharacterized protein YunC (DUF1805 family)
MTMIRKIRVGKNYILALELKLLDKKLIVLRGNRGYIMCGYLNLRVAAKFKDSAAKVVGVSSIQEALKASIHSCTYAAKKSGIYKGQPVKDALAIMA